RLSNKTEEVPRGTARCEQGGFDEAPARGERSAMEERWLSVEEIATHLGVSRDTVYKWIVRKNLPAHKVGKLWKFSTREVDEWVRASGANAGGRSNAGTTNGGSQS